MGKINLAAKIDFERDVAPLVTFLMDIGVSLDNIGQYVLAPLRSSRNGK